MLSADGIQEAFAFLVKSAQVIGVQQNLWIVAACLVPVIFAAPGLKEPWGNSEEGLNAAIWSLGARNILELGPSAAVRGANVTPHGGTRGDGIYAHHPPLPIWLMVVPVALGGSESGPRWMGLTCLGVALFFLHRLLSKYFSPSAALAGLGAAVMSTYALRYGRLFTTLTLCAPLFLMLLYEMVSKQRRAVMIPLVSALVFSSWDGVVASGFASFVFLMGWIDNETMKQRWTLAAAWSVSLGLVFWHLVDASGGIADLLWQFSWRSSGDHISWWEWGKGQFFFVGEGLGPVSIASLCIAPWFVRGQRRVMLLCLLAPGLVMELLFRQGATRHAFWGYLLLYPTAFAVSALCERWVRPATLLVTAQSAFALSMGTQHLFDEHEQNQLGEVAKTIPQHQVIPVVAKGAFHPYVSWYARSTPKTVRTADELRQISEPMALVDTTYAATLACRFEEGPRWRFLERASLFQACREREN